MACGPGATFCAGPSPRWRMRWIDDVVTIGLLAAVAVVLFLYLKRRRARLRDE